MSGAEHSGQEGLEDHYQRWFEHIDSDFRASSLNQLILAQVPKGLVLDVGCGSGALSADLLDAGYSVVSQDYSPKMVELCRAHLERRGHPQAQVRQGGIDTIDERAAFDAVIALDVIEHIEDDRAALTQLHRALKPTGRLVLSVPALSWLYGPKDEAVGHFRRYDKPDLLDLLRDTGFAVRSVRYWNVLGIGPVWLSNLRGKRLSEELRYSRSPIQRGLNHALGIWFRQVENRARPPVGMTLIVTADPR